MNEFTTANMTLGLLHILLPGIYLVRRRHLCGLDDGLIRVERIRDPVRTRKPTPVNYELLRFLSKITSH